MLFKGADMPAHRTLSDGQFLRCTGEGVVPGSGFKGPQGIKRRKTTRHKESSDSTMPKPYQNQSNMSFNHASNRFYPFVQWAESAENQPFPNLPRI